MIEVLLALTAKEFLMAKLIGYGIGFSVLLVWFLWPMPGAFLQGCKELREELRARREQQRRLMAILAEHNSMPPEDRAQAEALAWEQKQVLLAERREDREHRRQERLRASR
jgi:hypothetical protein